MADAQRRAELILEFKDNLSAGATAAAAGLGRVRTSADQLQRTAGATEQQFGRLSAQLNSGANTAAAQASIGQLDGLLKSGKISADQYGAAVGQIQLQSGLASKGSQDAADSLMQLGRQFSEGKITSEQYAAGVQNIQTELTATSESVKNLDKTINISRETLLRFAAIGVGALTAALTASIKSAAELQTTMGQIASLTDTPRAAIQGLTQDVIAMSRDLPVSAQELAEGLYFISSSGYQGAQAIDVLKASAKAASIGLGETKTIADAVTSALNAYKLQGADAARITDVLTQAVKEGKGEPDALAGSLGRVLPIAAAAGVSFEQVAASMATMTRTGLSADESATALRGTIGALLAPSKQAKDTLLGLGLTTEDVANKLKGDGLVATLQMLMERTEGNVETLDAIIPNMRALTGVLSSAGSQGEAYAEILQKMQDAAGSTDEAFGKMSDTFEFKLKKAQNALENLGTAVGNKLLPPLSAAADAAATLINWQDKLTEAFKGTEQKIRVQAATYEEYRSAAVATAQAAGKLIDVTGKLAIGLTEENRAAVIASRGWIEYEGRVYEVSQSLGILTQAQFEQEKRLNELTADLGDIGAYQTQVTANQDVEYQALATAKQLKEQAKATKEMLDRAAEATIANSNFVESFKSFDAAAGAQQTIKDLEDLLRSNPENRDNYAAQIRAIKQQFGLITPEMEVAASTFQKLEGMWMSGALSTESYALAMGNIQKAAADGKVSVDELGLKTGEAAAYMTAAAGTAKTEQEGIVNDARANKQRMMDEMNEGLAGQQTMLEGRISDSMLSVSNSLSTAKSLADTVTKEIKTAWARIPTDVTTTYHVRTSGSVPQSPANTQQTSGQASGGIIAGATGMIARGPTYLVGEGGYQTFAGQGAEGVIPLNDRGINILAEALARAMERMPAPIINNTAMPGIDLVTRVSQGLAAQTRQARRAGAGAMGR